MKIHTYFLLFSLVFLLSACSHVPTRSSSGSSSGNTVTEEEADVVLELKDYEFSPNVIEAVPGETLTILIKSSQGLHDFVVEDLDVASNIVSQGSSTVVEVEIPANSSGEEYEFHCSILNHRQMGMTGTIVVQ